MASPSSDVVVLGLGIVLAALYLFRGSIFPSSEGKKLPPVASKTAAAESGDPRDFVAKMKAGVSIETYLLRSVRDLYTRRSVLPYSMAHRPGPLKSMPFVWPRKPSLGLVLHRLSAIQKNMSSRTWTSFQRVAP